MTWMSDMRKREELRMTSRFLAQATERMLAKFAEIRAIEK